MKNLMGEAAMIPLRQLADFQNIDANSIRPINLEDMKQALENVKATVCQDDLDKFIAWNNQYGSFPLKKEDISD